ncbi:MAG: hypothetical protein GF381_02565 [Candidatus Pacebacteria bacterium]|nr:hypothetical protein [Candidatus Paceibacterota bacterium]
MASPRNPKKYVITDGDEGVQINTGVRLAFAGAGYQLDGFDRAVEILLDKLSSKIMIASSGQSDWMKQKLDLDEWEQVNASSQQQIQALADKHGLAYAGFLPFDDPEELEHGIKGHMVRPKGIHLANKICFTLGGGEQTYNLGQYLISADWVSFAKPAEVEQVIVPQIEFYQELAGKELSLIYQTDGKLGEKVAQKNLKALQKLGLELNES